MLKDAWGYELRAGQRVLYWGRQGSVVFCRVKRITRIEEGNLPGYPVKRGLCVWAKDEPSRHRPNPKETRHFIPARFVIHPEDIEESPMTHDPLWRERV